MTHWSTSFNLQSVRVSGQFIYSKFSIEHYHISKYNYCKHRHVMSICLSESHWFNNEKQRCLNLREHLGSTPVFVWVFFFQFLIVLTFFIVLFVFVWCLLCPMCCQCFWIIHISLLFISWRDKLENPFFLIPYQDISTSSIVVLNSCDCCERMRCNMLRILMSPFIFNNQCI